MRTLVTYPQLGHSYAINPGSPTSGAMLSTSSIPAPHLVQARARRRLLLERSDTIRRLGSGSSELRFSIVANARCAGWLRATNTEPLPRQAGSPAAAPGGAWIGNRPLDRPPGIFVRRAATAVTPPSCPDLPLSFSVCHPT